MHRQPSSSARARIERELAGIEEKPIAIEEPIPDGLVSSKQAAWIIGVNVHLAMAKLPGSGLPVTRIKRRVTGRRPWLFRREHIERIAKIRAAAGITLEAAIRVVVAEIEGRC